MAKAGTVAAALVDDIKALEDLYGRLPLSTLSETDKLALGEAVLGLERVRKRLSANRSDYQSWAGIVARDKEHTRLLTYVQANPGSVHAGTKPA